MTKRACFPFSEMSQDLKNCISRPWETQWLGLKEFKSKLKIFVSPMIITVFWSGDILTPQIHSFKSSLYAFSSRSFEVKMVLVTLNILVPNPKTSRFLLIAESIKNRVCSSSGCSLMREWVNSPYFTPVFVLNWTNVSMSFV